MPLPISTHLYPSGWQVCFPPHTTQMSLVKMFTSAGAFFLGFPSALNTPQVHKEVTNFCAISLCSTIKMTCSSVGVVRELQSIIASVILGCWQGCKLSPLLISSKLLMISGGSWNKLSLKCFLLSLLVRC